jgi:hypothetical protein
MNDQSQSDNQQQMTYAIYPAWRECRLGWLLGNSCLNCKTIRFSKLPMSLEIVPVNQFGIQINRLQGRVTRRFRWESSLQIVIVGSMYVNFSRDNLFEFDRKCFVVVHGKTCQLLWVEHFNPGIDPAELLAVKLIRNRSKLY